MGESHGVDYNMEIHDSGRIEYYYHSGETEKKIVGNWNVVDHNLDAEEYEEHSGEIYNLIEGCLFGEVGESSYRVEFVDKETIKLYNGGEWYEVEFSLKDY